MIERNSGLVLDDITGDTPQVKLSRVTDIISESIRGSNAISFIDVHGGKIAHSNRFGWTVLHHVAACGDRAVMEMLLSVAASQDVNIDMQGSKLQEKKKKKKTNKQTNKQTNKPSSNFSVRIYSFI